jgi:putative ABC transport system permease protein
MGLPLDYAVRNLGRSPARLALGVVGSMLVVLLWLTAAGFVRGMEYSLRSGGGAQNVLFFGAGSEESVERSEISPAVASLIAANVPGVRQRLGIPYVSPEIHMQATVSTAARPAPVQMLVRGVTPSAWLVHAGTRLIEGRPPRPASNEVLIGKLVPQRLGKVAVGDSIQMFEREWSVVGVFASTQPSTEAEIWTGLADLQVAARRDRISCVVATMERSDFGEADAFARQRLDLELVAMPVSEYQRKLSEFFRPVRLIVWATALLIAGGAVLGGMNTMYAAFATRVREIGALQSLGFTRRTIVKSLVQESLLLAAAGTVLAVILGLILLDGLAVRYSLGVFGLRIDPAVVLIGILVGLVLGVAGALPPAVRCLRLTVPEALKSE